MTTEAGFDRQRQQRQDQRGVNTIERSAARPRHANGVISGAAFVIDTVTITVINQSFGALDNGLFFVGLIAMVVSLVVLTMELSRRGRGLARIALAVAVFVVSFTALASLAGVMDAWGRAVFSTSNVGLHGEWSFFSVGLVMLGTALWAHRSAR